MAGTIHRQETVDCLRKFNARRKLKVKYLWYWQEEENKRRREKIQRKGRAKKKGWENRKCIFIYTVGIFSFLYFFFFCRYQLLTEKKRVLDGSFFFFSSTKLTNRWRERQAFKTQYLIEDNVFSRCLFDMFCCKLSIQLIDSSKKPENIQLNFSFFVCFREPSYQRCSSIVHWYLVSRTKSYCLIVVHVCLLLIEIETIVTLL